MAGSRNHTRLERAADACVHVVGFGAAVVGTVVLALLAGDDAPKLAAVLVYSAGLLAMLGASAAYNLGYHTRFRAFLQRCDHSAIFLMIAGTYTPFTTNWYNGAYAVAVTSFIWILALGGIVMRNLAPLQFQRWKVFLYLGLGWIAVAVVGPMMLAAAPPTLIAFVSGGLLYTVGVAFYVWKALPYQNAIWHAFVVCAAACHYGAVLEGVVLKA